MSSLKITGLALVAMVVTGLAAQRPGAVFLMIWPGTRPTALGGAFVGVADDALATYYNQGGLAFLSSTEVNLMHCNWLPGLYPGMYYEFLGIARPLNSRGTLGFGIIYLSTGKTVVTDDIGRKLGEYTTFDVAAGPSYGVKLSEDLGLGFGFKFIYSFLIPQWVIDVRPDLGIERGGTGATWALDFGALYRPFPILSVGAAIQNLGPDISYTDTGVSDPLPRMLRVGIGFTPIHSRYLSIRLVPEVTKVLVGMFYDPKDTLSVWEEVGYEFNEAWKSFGIEASYLDLFTLRAGYFDDPTGARGGFKRTEEGKVVRWPFTFGGGVRFRGFAFDVAVDQYLYDFPTQNYKLSLAYRF